MDEIEELQLHPRIKTEAAKGRTYGECVMDEIMSIRMIDGEFRTTLHIKEKPKRLCREDAFADVGVFGRVSRKLSGRLKRCETV